MDGVAVATAGASTDVLNRLASLELENADLKKGGLCIQKYLFYFHILDAHFFILFS